MEAKDHILWDSGKILGQMGSAYLVIDFDVSFGLLVINLGNTENFRPNGLHLLRNGF